MNASKVSDKYTKQEVQLMNGSTQRHKVTKIKARTKAAQKAQKNLTQSRKGAKVKTDEPQMDTDLHG